jgi:hypothetical protein
VQQMPSARLIFDLEASKLRYTYPLQRYVAQNGDLSTAVRTSILRIIILNAMKLGRKNAFTKILFYFILQPK